MMDGPIYTVSRASLASGFSLLKVWTDLVTVTSAKSLGNLIGPGLRPCQREKTIYCKKQQIFSQHFPHSFDLHSTLPACRIAEQIDCQCSWAPPGLMMFIPGIVIVNKIINMFLVNGYQLLMSTTGLCQCRLSRNVIFSTLSIQWTNKSH